MKPQSMVTVKHKFQRLASKLANKKVIDFQDELQKLANDVIGVAAPAIIEQLINAKMPPRLKKSINPAHLENGTFDQIVSHLEKQLELNGLEASDELQIKTVTQQLTQTKSGKPKPTCHHCKKPGHHQNQCRQLKQETDFAKNNTNSAGNNNKNNNAGQTNSNSNNKIPKNTSVTNTNNRNDRKPRPVYAPCETCGKTNHSRKKCYIRANAANRPPPGNRRSERQNQGQEKNDQNNSDVNVQVAAQTLN